MKSVVLKHLEKGTVYFSILDVLSLISVTVETNLTGPPNNKVIAIAFGCQVELDGWTLFLKTLHTLFMDMKESSWY